MCIHVCVYTCVCVHVYVCTSYKLYDILFGKETSFLAERGLSMEVRDSPIHGRQEENNNYTLVHEICNTEWSRDSNTLGSYRQKLSLYTYVLCTTASL